MKHTVRIAPSPSGSLHLGTIRMVYFNWLIAKQNKDSKLIVRIDDTDANRCKPELIQPIFDTLEWLGMDFDITFNQSSRYNRYTEIANILLDLGIAKRDDGCIRLDNTKLDNFSCDWQDTLSGDKISNEHFDTLAKNQVIIKSDGTPVYHFASTVDDFDSEITWIVRGVDHIGNTYNHSLLWRILVHALKTEIELPLFTHVGLVCHKTGAKISKRDSDSMNLTELNPDALLNYVLRLGWSPQQDDKSNNIIDKDKAIKLFLEAGNMRSANSKIDLIKMAWYNKKYSNFAQRV